MTTDRVHEARPVTGEQVVHPEALLIDPFFTPDALAALLAPNVAVRVGGPDDASEVTVAVITVDRPVRAQELAHLPHLRLVIAASVGFDHVDLAGFRDRGVKVCHTPAYCTEEVADHTIAAVLSLLRGLQCFDRAIQRREWDIASGGPIRRIRGTKLGIVGLGRIGRGVAARAHALGMEVIGAHSPHGAENVAAPEVRPASVEELLAEADVVSLHVPSDPDAPPLLGAEQLALMRPRALLVNTGRAALVDLDALCERLERGHLAGAQSQREKALRRFTTGPPVCSSPPTSAPGLDVDDITNVVNFDRPRRTRGRAGASIMFVAGRAGAGHGPAPRASTSCPARPGASRARRAARRLRHHGVSAPTCRVVRAREGSNVGR